jgi:hypothetical protein
MRFFLRKPNAWKGLSQRQIKGRWDEVKVDLKMPIIRHYSFVGIIFFFYLHILSKYSAEISLILMIMLFSVGLVLVDELIRAIFLVPAVNRVEKARQGRRLP